MEVLGSTGKSNGMLIYNCVVLCVKEHYVFKIQTVSGLGLLQGRRLWWMSQRCKCIDLNSFSIKLQRQFLITNALFSDSKSADSDPFHGKSQTPIQLFCPANILVHIFLKDVTGFCVGVVFSFFKEKKYIVCVLQ